MLKITPQIHLIVFHFNIFVKFVFQTVREVPLDEPAGEDSSKDLTYRNDVSLESKEQKNVQEGANLPITSEQPTDILHEEKSIVSPKSKLFENDSVIMKVKPH